MPFRDLVTSPEGFEVTRQLVNALMSLYTESETVDSSTDGISKVTIISYYLWFVFNKIFFFCCSRCCAHAVLPFSEKKIGFTIKPMNYFIEPRRRPAPMNEQRHYEVLSRYPTYPLDYPNHTDYIIFFQNCSFI